jgi:hypothetical protein
MQRVQALTLLPSCLTHCRLGDSRVIVALMEWLRLIVLEYPLPQIAHILGISFDPLVTLVLDILSDTGIIIKYGNNILFSNFSLFGHST